MTPMAVPLHGIDVVWRLLLTVLAGLLLGYNRTEHGKAAGLRTMVLVCLAASVAMIQVNLLLPMTGRASDSFVMNDLMRLPLGILTGVGFIGGGAILHRDSIVTGVTTAATLWLGTVIGLCLGGGQISLGVAATGLGLAALWGMNWIEARLWLEREAHIAIEADINGPGEAALRRAIEAAGLQIAGTQISLDVARAQRSLLYRVRELRRDVDHEVPGVVDALAREPGIHKVEWKL